MESITEALELLKRQAILEHRMRQAGGIRVIEERELYAVRERVQHYPQAVAAILAMASDLHRPVDTLSTADLRNLS
ncbi:MAG: hypothetical protein ABSF94_17335 [Steroidobacteraceae bacterium]|jgi:hypothetical protein